MIFNGNKKISDTQISEISELKPGTILSEVKIFGAIQNILEKYREKHFHNVQIDTLIERIESGERANINFKLSVFIDFKTFFLYPTKPAVGSFIGILVINLT